MSDWMLPRITDYWDWQVDAVERLSQTLAEMNEAERPGQTKLIGEAVTRHVDALNDHFLRLSAVAVVEDLYKSAVQLTSLGETQLRYLQASATPYFRALTRRGYTVEYFIDNTFSRLDGPAIAFPLWFRAASLAYVCPQHLAATEIEKDKPASEWPSLVSKHIVDGRAVADLLADRCHKERRHFVYLDIDTDGFQAAFKTRGAPGVVHVLRNDAPTPGSRITIEMPPGPFLAEDPTQTPAVPRSSPDLPNSGEGANHLGEPSEVGKSEAKASAWQSLRSFLGGGRRA